MDTASIVLATLTEPMLRLKNVEYVLFECLNFQYGHCNSSAVSVENCKKIEISGCVVANQAGSGIGLSGKENLVRSCDLFNLGRSGISLNGGNRDNLIPAKNQALNNHIHHYGIFQRTYAPGIGANGCGQIVKNNCIHDAPHNAILYGGNEHLFEFNEVYRAVMETGDAGAFYTGRDWTSQGNVLRHNFIHSLGGGDSKHVNTMGFYFDDCDCGDRVEGNIFWKAGRAIMIGGGRENPVINNLIVDCPIGVHIDSRGMTWKHWNNTNEPSWCLNAKARAFDYTHPPWSVRYPRLASIMTEHPREPLNNPVRNNVFLDCKEVCSFDDNVMNLLYKMEISGNLIVNTTGTNSMGNLKKGIDVGFRTLSGKETDPLVMGFKNVAEGDFSMARSARLLKEAPSFKRIPFERMGLYTDAYRRKLPQR